LIGVSDPGPNGVDVVVQVPLVTSFDLFGVSTNETELG